MRSEQKEKNLVLIDAHALIHRAFHALPPLNTGRGELVNAVFGFTSILLKVMRELKPDYIAAAFDLAGPTFRHKEYDAYKATRAKAPDELYQQIGRVKEILAAFNIPVFEKEGFEADDILGTIVKTVNGKQPAVNSEKEKLKTIIVTGDLDTLQLVDENTAVYTLKKGVKETIVYDEAAVRERFGGLAPARMNDFKGLKGDPSDNIPGVPGVGDKTAVELLKQYGSIENLYQEIEKQGVKKQETRNKKQKLFEKLIENKDQAFFSKYLATIKRDVPLEFDLEKTAALKFDREKVVALFKELGFYSLVERFAAEIVRPSGGLSQGDGDAISAGTAGSTPAQLRQRDDEIFEKLELAYQQGVFSPQIYELEKNLVPVLAQMQNFGIKIDVEHLKNLGRKVNQKLAAAEKNIYAMAGAEFNINSPQQLSDVLFSRLGVATKGLKKTPGKVISTAAPELIKLRGSHKIIDLILEHRELMKLKTTYIDALPKLVAADGRVHTTYDQLGAITGRLSSKNPNLQNIPVKTELGNEIRKAFVAEEGHKLLSADYSQIELRVVASLAKDEKMIAALGAGADIHTLTAAEIFEIAPAEVDAKMRKAAKALNFGVIYGMGTHGFAQAAGIEQARAKIFIQKYFEEFAGVARYLEETKAKALKLGYIETLFGRKRFIPEINSSAWNLRAAAERMAINMPAQGTAADLIKMAMMAVANRIAQIAKRKESDDARLAIGDSRQAISPKLLLQVHDELVFEAPAQDVERFAREIKNIMENIYALAVPLKVEIEVGDNWGEMAKI